MCNIYSSIAQKGNFREKYAKQEFYQIIILSEITLKKV